MKLSVIYIITFFLMTNAALGQERYQNEVMNFSFTLPEGWEQTPTKKLTDYYLFLINSRSETHAVEVFSLKTNNRLKTPYIYLEAFPVKKSDIEREKAFLVENSQERTDKFLKRRVTWLQDGTNSVIESWKGAELIEADSYYDKDKHMHVKTIELYNKRAGNIVYINARFSGAQRATVLTGYHNGKGSENFLDTVYAIIDSFKYDQGHGFGEGKSKLVSEAVLSGSVSEAGGIQEKAMAFIVNALIFAVCLWLGMKITSEEGSFFALVFISAVCSLVGLIPVAGWILSAVVMYILLCKMLEMKFFPDAVIVVVVANIISNLVGFGLMASMAAK